MHIVWLVLCNIVGPIVLYFGVIMFLAIVDMYHRRK